jgi:hypothetical protein
MQPVLQFFGTFPSITFLVFISLAGVSLGLILRGLAMDDTQAFQPMSASHSIRLGCSGAIISSIAALMLFMEIVKTQNAPIKGILLACGGGFLAFLLGFLTAGSGPRPRE